MSALRRRMLTLCRVAVQRPKIRLQAPLSVEVASPESCCCRYFHVTAWASRVREVPSQMEVHILQKIYPNPKQLVYDLFSPLIDSSVAPEPHIVFTPRHSLDGKLWRATLHLTWPNNVVISGIQCTLSGAEENAYLLACNLLRDSGLLYKDESDQMKAVDRDYTLNLLRRLHTPTNPLSPPPPQFQLLTTPIQPRLVMGLAETRGKRGREQPQKAHLWETHVHAFWPYPFQVCETGPSVEISQYAAALKTCMKLKALGLLSRTNEMSPEQLACLSRSLQWSKHQTTSSAGSSKVDFDPDYEIYCDASVKGFGAYLLTRDDDCVRWLANTWAEHFPWYSFTKHRRDVCTVGDMYLDSTFFEMYAVVAASYTWKHKFVDKRVLVWTDNLNVAKMVSGGVWTECSRHRVGKLFHILNYTCSKHHIKLRGAHIQRTENTAADLLSRYQLAAFKEAVPDATPSSKKTKKLLFWNPLQTVPCLNEMLFQDAGDTILVPSFPGQKYRSRKSGRTATGMDASDKAGSHEVNNTE